MKVSSQINNRKLLIPRRNTNNCLVNRIKDHVTKGKKITSKRMLIPYFSHDFLLFEIPEQVLSIIRGRKDSTLVVYMNLQDFIQSGFMKIQLTYKNSILKVEEL